MELFKEFAKDEICYLVIKEYLEKNLNSKLIEQLRKNKDKPLKELSGVNENIGKFKLIPFNPFSLEDYKLFKSVIQNKEIMKSTSIFKSNIPSEKQAMENFLLKSLSHILFSVGTYKIYKENNLKFGGIVGINVARVGNVSSLKVVNSLKYLGSNTSS